MSKRLSRLIFNLFCMGDIWPIFVCALPWNIPCLYYLFFLTLPICFTFGWEFPVLVSAKVQAEYLKFLWYLIDTRKLKNRYQYTGETCKLKIYLVLWIDQLGSSTVWFWNTDMIHSHYLHKPWSKLLAKVPAKIWIFEFHCVYSWCWSQPNGRKSKK